MNRHFIIGLALGLTLSAGYSLSQEPRGSSTDGADPYQFDSTNRATRNYFQDLQSKPGFYDTHKNPC